MTERWLPIVGYEAHYEVSDSGSVRRTLATRGATAGRVLRQQGGDGYRYVQLCKNDIKRKRGVHILVAEAFYGKRPRGKVPNHKNLQRHDNRVDNLEWLTQRQNVRHGIANGRIPGRAMPGEQNGRAKLSAAQAELILRLKGIVGQRELALLCGVCKSTIQFIHQGKHWRELQPESLRIREFPKARP